MCVCKYIGLVRFSYSFVFCWFVSWLIYLTHKKSHSESKTNSPALTEDVSTNTTQVATTNNVSILKSVTGFHSQCLCPL